MKRILINATHNEEIRVALCKDNHLYDFDLENRTREQKKANIYKGHITRIEPSLEAAFVEYGSQRQGFLPLREIASEYLHGNAREDSIKQLLKEGDEVIVQVEKEERGNKGAALSTYISLAGRYLVLMPNNAKAGGISRQISGKVREEMKQIIAGLNLPKGMSVIVRTAGLGKGAEDLQNDLDHLLDIWKSIQEQNKNHPSPCLVHQEAGVVTRAVRDYLRDDIGEVWIDSENAYNEAANFISAVMPAQMSKLRKYTDYEPMFARFGIERQIETAYQREVRLPSGGSIVIDQTEALVSIDINSSKSTKGSDVAETAYHTNLEAADEIARQLRLRDMGGLIVIDFIDMSDARHQKDVEKRLVEATRHDRARVQFAEISKFGLMEMSRQRLRPSLEEATGYICPRCHGNGMIRDLRSLSLSIMRQIEQIALKERMGEIQAEVPTDIAAFLLNEKRESLVYLEQDSGARITILPHAHLESPNFSLHFNPDGFAPSSYERIADTEEKENIDRGYEVNWQTDNEKQDNSHSRWHKADGKSTAKPNKAASEPQSTPAKAEPQAVAWLSNLFAPKPQAKLAGSLGTADAASAIEALANGGGVSLGASGNINTAETVSSETTSRPQSEDKRHKKSRHTKKEVGEENNMPAQEEKHEKKTKKDTPKESYPKREAGVRRESRGEIVRGETLSKVSDKADKSEKTDRADKAVRQEAVRQEKAKDKADKPARQKATNPDEIVLHISSTKEPEVGTQIVHLSLDDSKPKKAKAEEPKASKHSTADDSKADDRSDAADAIAKQLPTADADLTKADQADLAHADLTKNTDAATDTPVATVKADELPAQPTDSLTVKTVANAEPTTTAVTPAISPDLAAKIEQLAKSMNKAVNDPRVVQMAMQAPTQPLTGSAGALIAQVLGNAATGNFVADFINALNQSQSPAAAFDFANFGYSPLDAAAKSEFDKQIQAVAQTSAPQGKTNVEPRPVARRASNDPRGQHPDYVDTVNHTAAATAPMATDLPLINTVADTPVAEVADTVNVDAVSETAKPAQDTADATSLTAEVVNLVDDLVDNGIANLDEQTKNLGTAVENLAHDAIDVAVLTAEQISDSISDTVSETIDNVATIVSAAAEFLTTDDTGSNAGDTDNKDTAPTVSDDTPADANQAATAEPKNSESKSKKGGQIKEITAEQKTEKKSKANSYKDMIENVAGQLQPQIGILNLMTTKTPKTPKTPKTRAPRKPSKKPTKVEVRKISKTAEVATSDTTATNDTDGKN
ncbi:Rne/Rng family ribonuclease [Moraxella sp. ZJ142]|uniref:Rne/Rng family ribonuclease n=1 Tax=Moraxella marmotae TaxID=3344520 RepID=UPI0035D4AB91